MRDGWVFRLSLVCLGISTPGDPRPPVTHDCHGRVFFCSESAGVVMRVYLQVRVQQPFDDEGRSDEELEAMDDDELEELENSQQTLFVIPWPGPMLNDGALVTPIPEEFHLEMYVTDTLVHVPSGAIIIDCEMVNECVPPPDVYAIWERELRKIGWLTPDEQYAKERDEPCMCETCQMERMVKDKTKGIVKQLGETIADRIHNRRRHDQNNPGTN